MRKEARYWFAGALGKYILDALLATTSFNVTSGARPDGPVIFTLWHGRLLPLTYFHRKQNIATLISQSADGEYIARVVERWGYTAIRGSSSRGGTAALREMVKEDVSRVFRDIQRSVLREQARDVHLGLRDPLTEGVSYRSWIGGVSRKSSAV